MIGTELHARKQIISELETRLNITKTALLNILEEWYYYHDVLQPQILFDYERHFGDIELELQGKKRKILEIERRTELISQKVKRGEKITEYSLKIVDLIIKKEFNRKERLEQRNIYDFKANNFRKSGFTNFTETRNNNFKISNNRIVQDPVLETGYKSQFKENSTQKYHPEGNFYFNNQRKTSVSAYRIDWRDYLDEMQIPHLYRSIVKKIHPDLKGESDAFKKYWHNVQDAYRTKNSNRLKLFFLALCIDEEKFYSSLEEKEYDLRRMLIDFESRLSEEQNKLNSMKLSEPFVLLDKLKDRLWIAKRKRYLRDKLFQISNQIQFKEKQLMRLSSELNHTTIRFSNTMINKTLRVNS